MRKSKHKSDSDLTIFDTIEFDAFSNRENLYLPEEKLFKKYLAPLNKNIKILDIGTGNGRIPIELAQLNYTDVTGIDLSKKLLEIAQKRSIDKYPFLKFIKMDASKLDFPDSTFDFIIATEQIFCCISNSKARKRAFSEAYRVLKENGTLVLSSLDYKSRKINPILSVLLVPFKFFTSEKDYYHFQYLPWLKIGVKKNDWLFFLRNDFTYWYKKNELITEIKNAGFSILEITTSKMLKNDIQEYTTGGMIYLVAKKESDNV